MAAEVAELVHGQMESVKSLNDFKKNVELFYFSEALFHLIKLPVMFLNGCSILQPDFLPLLVLTELSQLIIGVGGVALTVLLLPGLTSSENI